MDKQKMNLNMKKIHYIIVLLLASICCMSCENFRDNNGELGGMWQLTQWRTRSSSGQIDSLVANNIREDSTLENKHKLYYAIHRDVFQVSDAAEFYNTRYYCTFSLTGNNEIVLGNLVDFSGSLLVDGTNAQRNYSKYAEFGIPYDGRYHIDVLTAEDLRLSFKDNILVFRKY